MALFGKPKMISCAFCGKEVKTGLLRGLFQRQIEGQYVCDDCYGNVDLPGEVLKGITLDQFRAYMAFREENNKLRDQFEITREVDFGVFEEKIVFDMNHRLLSMYKDLSKTIFEAKHIRSFTIREGSRTIFAGGPNGLTVNKSNVPEQIRTMESQVRMFQIRKAHYEHEIARMSDEERQNSNLREPRFDMRQPFDKFLVEIQLDHPYWHSLTADLSAPHMDSRDPDIFEYLRKYEDGLAVMEDMADALMELAFPRAAQQAYAAAQPGFGYEAAPVAQRAPAAPSASAVEELKNFKELLDLGIITQEEFNAKKRQLLGL